MKLKAGVLRRSTKLDKLAKLMRGKIANIRNKRGDFKRIIRVYYEPLYANKFTI